jgi:hypothetical protein
VAEIGGDIAGDVKDLGAMFEPTPDPDRPEESGDGENGFGGGEVSVDGPAADDIAMGGCIGDRAGVGSIGGAGLCIRGVCVRVT